MNSTINNKSNRNQNTNNTPNSNNKNQNHCIKLIHWNCNSIKGQKIEELKEFLMQAKPDIVSLNEIKCNKSNANAIFSDITNYNVIFKARSNAGGGVALLIKNSIIFDEIQIDINNDIELIGANLTINRNNSKESLEIYSYYNPPNVNLNLEALNKILKDKTNTIIMGDLNAKNTIFGSDKTNKNGEILEDFITNSSAQILNSDFQPTYHNFKGNQADYHSCLDYVIGSTYIATIVSKCKTFNSCFLNSDHSPMETVLGIDSERNKDTCPDTNKLYNFDKANWSDFKIEIIDAIANISNEYLNSLNKDQLNEIIIKTITTAMENNIPKIKTRINPKKFNLPQDIIQTIRIRNKWQKIYRKHKHPESKKMVNSLNSIIRSEIANFKEQKWLNFLLNLGKNPISTVPFWKKINLVRNGRSSNKIGNLVVNGQIINDDNVKLNLFVDKLTKTFNHDPCEELSFDAENNQKVNENILSFLNNLSKPNNSNSKEFLTIKNSNNILFNGLNFNCNYDVKLTHIGEVKKAIKKSNNKPTLDQNGLSNKIIKKLPDRMVGLVVKLFNLCLLDNKFCYNWKNAFITMIPKKGDRTNINNYRPISSTSCLMKLFERIIASRLRKFMHQNKILIKYQSGFRNERQTKDNLMFLTQKSMENLQRKRKAICILFDIKQAFDKVWHLGLIQKLINHNLPVYLIVWFYEFLTKRTFNVKINGVVSQRVDIGCGVPQGAVLSPILFSLYINDIPLNTSPNNKYSFLFADDLAYLHLVKKISKKAVKAINVHLKNLEKWLAKWKLKMSNEKSHYIIFSNKDDKDQSIDLFLYNSRISKNNFPNFLGVILDRRLTFNKNFENLRKRCMDRMNVLKVLAHKSWKLSKSTLLQIYKTLVRSLLEYSMFTYPQLNQINKKRMQAIQNNALRVIYHKKFDESVSPLHDELKLPSIEKRAKTLTMEYLNKAKSNENPMIRELVEDYEHLKKYKYNNKNKRQSLLEYFNE